jgi:predicted O-linked N-acetylglucosamine transferase (SPINDLY family)
MLQSGDLRASEPMSPKFPHPSARQKIRGSRKIPSAQPSRSTILAQALSHHRGGRPAEAEKLYQEILRSNPRDLEIHLLLGTLYLETGRAGRSRPHLQNAALGQPKHARAAYHYALALDACGEHAQAVQQFRAALVCDDADPEVWYRAGLAEARVGNVTEADRCFVEACQRRPRFCEAILQRAELARRQGRSEEAIAFYWEAIEADPLALAPVNNLALLLKRQGRYEQALKLFEQAILLDVAAVEPHTNRAICLTAMGHLQESLEAVRKAADIAPNHPLVHDALGRIHWAWGNADLAVASLQRAIELDPTPSSRRILLGQALSSLGRVEEAAGHFQKSLAHETSHRDAKIGLAQVLEKWDQVDQARALFVQSTSDDDRTLARWRSACVCPAVMLSESEIDAYRAGLKEIVEEIAVEAPQQSALALAHWGIMPPFNLAFHGRDDRPLKEAFARATSAVLRIAGDAGPTGPTSSPPTIGFLCLQNPRAFVRSIGGLLLQWSQPDFRPVVMTPLSCRPVFEEEWRGVSQFYVHWLPQGLKQTIATIRRQRYHMLVHFEIGTSPLGYLLAHHRLAPVQVTTWGIQVTSGVPTIDAYLSSRWVEGACADDHYSERLVLGESLLSWQPRRPPGKAQPREAWGLPADSHFYLCPQQLGKFTPAFDIVLERLFHADPAAHLVITLGQEPRLVDRLVQRWQQTLPGQASRIHWLPQQTGEHYESLLRSADVLLDPIGFGGVNTTYDALGAGKAVVTWPTEFQRGRYTAGCYAKMGLDACVANSADDYVERAMRLARDRDYRDFVEREILDRHEAIFEDTLAVADWQEQLTRLAQGSGP